MIPGCKLFSVLLVISLQSFTYRYYGCHQHITQTVFTESVGNIIKVFFAPTRASAMRAVRAGLCSKS